MCKYIYLSIYLSIHPSLSLYIYGCVCIYIYIYIHLSISLSLYLSISLSSSLSLSPYIYIYISYHTSDIERSHNMFTLHATLMHIVLPFRCARHVHGASEPWIRTCRPARRLHNTYTRNTYTQVHADTHTQTHVKQINTYKYNYK